MTNSDRGIVSLVAAVVLAVAMVRWDSQTARILILIPAILLVAVAALWPTGEGGSLDGQTKRIIGMVAVGVAACVYAAWFVDRFAPSSSSDWVTALLVLVPLMGCAAMAAIERGRYSWIGFVAFCSLALVLVILKTHGDVVIDVQIFQTDSVASLIRGGNPFAITFLDPYSASDSAMFYGDGVSVGGVLQFGYPYYPLSLLLIAPFEILVRDFRFAHAVALVIAGVLMERMHPGILARRAAICFLLGAPCLFVVRFGWIDPLLVLAAVVVVFAVSRGRESSSYLVGLMLAVKQISVLLALPSLLTLQRPWGAGAVLRHFARAGLVFLLVTVPFALRDPSAFWNSVVTLQLHQPFRPDSIAFPALVPAWFSALPSTISLGVPMLIVGAVTILVLMKTPVGAQGFALGSALVLLTAFAIAKQAFPNYYIVVIALLCAAAAASQVVERPVVDPVAVETAHEPIDV
jgi:hypothetical protein